MKWYHNDYSQEAIAEMQKEAERRVSESRERARLLAGGSFPQTAVPPQNAQVQKPFLGKNQNSENFSLPPQNPFSEISKMLGGFGGDKLIILAVLWLLWNEHADAKLLLALIYIIL